MQVDKSWANKLPPSIDNLIRWSGSIGTHIGNGIPFNHHSTVLDEFMVRSGPADYYTAFNSDDHRILPNIGEERRLQRRVEYDEPLNFPQNV